MTTFYGKLIRSLAGTAFGAIMTGVKAVRAHVHDGQIVLDEPVDLPEGAAVEVRLPEHNDDDHLTAEEHAEFEAALEEGVADFARGNFEDARAFALRLVARS